MADPAIQRRDRLLAVYDAFNDRDLDAALRAMAPDAEWDTSRVFPDGVVYRGREAIRGYFEEAIARWGEEFRIAPEELVESGDMILVVCRMHVRGTVSGVPLDIPFAHVVTFRGEQIVRGHNFLDREAGLRALGLDATGPASSRGSPS